MSGSTAEPDLHKHLVFTKENEKIFYSRQTRHLRFNPAYKHAGQAAEPDLHKHLFFTREHENLLCYLNLCGYVEWRSIAFLLLRIIPSQVGQNMPDKHLRVVDLPLHRRDGDFIVHQKRTRGHLADISRNLRKSGSIQLNPVDRS